MDRESAGEENTRQDMLREYQEKYRILTDLMPLGAFRLGPAPDYRVISTNRMFPQMLGFDSGDVIVGIPVKDLMIDPAHWQQIESDLLRDGSVTQRELQLKQKEGSGILVALNARIVPDSDVPVAWVDGVAEDVTERKVLEMEMHYHEAEVNRYALALTRANEKLNLLSSITRHDILNQLTALSGYLELMSEGPKSPQIQKYIDIEKRIAETIKKQIQFTKDYHEIGVQSPQWYNVKKAIETATAPLPLHQGMLVVSIENISIYADPLLEKVFYNLVENALRYGRDPSGSRSPPAFRETLSRSSVKITVKGFLKNSKKRSSDDSTSNIPVSGFFYHGRSWASPASRSARAVNKAKGHGLRSRCPRDISTLTILPDNSGTVLF